MKPVVAYIISLQKIFGTKKFHGTFVATSSWVIIINHENEFCSKKSLLTTNVIYGKR